MDIDESYGDFDFIFAHGLFSWVPEPVRYRVLEICSDRLAPNGVAYLSYNAYPGSYQRDMLRAMLQIHTRNIADPVSKIRQSLGLIDFIRSSPFRDTPYHQFIQGVHEHRGKAPRRYCSTTNWGA
jgi:SAM-dependent methyltransferase